jgi:hypothetical protein
MEGIGPGGGTRHERGRRGRGRVRPISRGTRARARSVSRAGGVRYQER